MSARRRYPFVLSSLALAQARSALGLFTAPFTDSTAGSTIVKRLHIVELRNGAF